MKTLRRIRLTQYSMRQIPFQLAKVRSARLQCRAAGKNAPNRNRLLTEADRSIKKIINKYRREFGPEGTISEGTIPDRREMNPDGQCKYDRKDIFFHGLVHIDHHYMSVRTHSLNS